MSKEKMKKVRKESMRLYAVTDRTWLNGHDLKEHVEEALKGGVTFVQLREKNLDNNSFLEEAVEINKLCKKYQVPFVINDNVDIALLSNADGVHVGQNDLEVKKARAILGPDKIIGVSVRTVEQAQMAEEQGADYLGVGAAFKTSTKSDAKPIPYDSLKEICSSVHIPVVAIGGINRSNIHKLSGSGIDGVAVVSAVFAQPDIKNSTKELLEMGKTLFD